LQTLPYRNALLVQVYRVFPALLYRRFNAVQGLLDYRVVLALESLPLAVFIGYNRWLNNLTITGTVRDG